MEEGDGEGAGAGWVAVGEVGGRGGGMLVCMWFRGYPGFGWIDRLGMRCLTYRVASSSSLSSVCLPVMFIYRT